MPLNVPWRPRTFQEGDRARIPALLRDVFSPREDGGQAYWDWQYLRNPAGFFPETVAVAVDGERLVGHYAIAPVTMEVAGNRLLAAQSVGTATHKDYRRQGIFNTLARECYSAARRSGIAFIYGVAVEGPSLSGLRKLGWDSLGFMVEYQRIVLYRKAATEHFARSLPSPLVGLLAAIAGIRDAFHRTPSPPQGTSFRWTDSVDPRLADLTSSPKTGVSVARTFEYLKWRLGRPGSRYRVLLAERAQSLRGCAIVIENDWGGWIVDLVVPIDDHALRHSILLEVLENLRSRGVGVARMRLTPDHPLAQDLLNGGWSAHPSRTAFVVKVLTEDSVVASLVRQSKAWMYMDLDSDHV